MPDELPLTPGTLESKFACYQELYAEMFARGAAQAPAVKGLLIQDNTPDPTDIDKGWIPTSGGVPRYPGYVFVWHVVLGHWVSRHYKLPGDPRPEMYTGDPADLPTFDGGSAGSGIAGGPMWEVYTEFAGRVPVGLGAIPGSAAVINYQTPPPTQDSLGNSGEYKHVLTSAEGAVADHEHPIGVADPTSDDAFFRVTGPPSTPTPSYNAHFITGSGHGTTLNETTANLFTLKANNGNGVVSDGHNNMQPWIGVTFIRRTSREFYVAA